MEYRENPGIKRSSSPASTPLAKKGGDWRACKLNFSQSFLPRTAPWLGALFRHQTDIWIG